MVAGSTPGRAVCVSQRLPVIQDDGREVVGRAHAASGEEEHRTEEKEEYGIAGPLPTCHRHRLPVVETICGGIISIAFEGHSLNERVGRVSQQLRVYNPQSSDVLICSCEFWDSFSCLVYLIIGGCCFCGVRDFNRTVHGCKVGFTLIEPLLYATSQACVELIVLLSWCMSDNL